MAREPKVEDEHDPGSQYAKDSKKRVLVALRDMDVTDKEHVQHKEIPANEHGRQDYLRGHYQQDAGLVGEAHGLLASMLHRINLRIQPRPKVANVGRLA